MNAKFSRRRSRIGVRSSSALMGIVSIGSGVEGM